MPACSNPGRLMAPMPADAFMIKSRREFMGQY
jgi:hypothetical protein